MPISSPTEKGIASPLLSKELKNEKTKKNLHSTLGKIHQSNNYLEVNNIKSCIESSGIREDIDELNNMMEQGRITRFEVESVIEKKISELKPQMFFGYNWKTALVGLGLTATGAASSLFFRYYRDNSQTYSDNPNQPILSTTPTQPNSRQAEIGGVYDDSFGNHGLHHDGNRNGVRHGRRHLTNPTQENSHDKNPTKVYKQLDDVLRKSGYIKDGIVSKEERVSALANFIINPLNELFHQAKLKEIASIIITHKNLYSGDDNNILSNELAELVVQNFIINEILGMTIEEYIANKMMTEDKGEPYTISDLKYLLTLPFPDKKLIELSNIPDDQRAKFYFLWQTYMEKIFPFININSNHPNLLKMQLDSIEFANYYTGVKFLKSISVNDFTKDEAIETGKVIWQMACDNGISEYPIEFFIAPALFAIQAPINPSDPEESDSRINAIMQYIAFRKYLGSIQQDIENKFNGYRTALELWHPKGELAENEINLCGENLKSPFTITDLYSHLLSPEKRLKKAKADAKQAYLNGEDKPCDTAPDILEEFYAQKTANVADKFAEFDNILITLSWGNISTEDRAFIESQGVIFDLVEAKQIKESVPYMYVGYSAARQRKLQDALKETDLVLVQVGNEKRLYAMKRGNSASTPYNIDRLYTTSHEMLDWAGTLSKQTVTAYLAPKGWGVEKFILTNPQRLPSSNKGAGPLIAGLTDKHRKAIYDALYSSGNDKSTRQKVWDVTKSFIPFYDCATAPLDEAIPSCIFDTIALLSFAGEVASSSLKIGQAGVLGALRASTKGVMANNIPVLLQAAFESGVVNNIKPFLSIGKSALRFVDPFFESLTKFSTFTLEKLKGKLSKQLDTKKIVEAINLVLDERNPRKILSLVPQNLQVSPIKGKVISKLDNGGTVFIPFVQQEVLNDFKIDNTESFEYIPRENHNPIYYGNGQVYEQKQRDYPYEFTQGIFVEMNGKIVPVRLSEHWGSGAIYEIYDIKNPSNRGYSIEWDGERWVFEKTTSKYIPGNIENLISEKAFAKNIDKTQLSAPNKSGIRTDSKGCKYIKIKKRFVQLYEKKDDFTIVDGIDTYTLKFNDDIGNFQLIKKQDNTNYLRGCGLLGRAKRSPCIHTPAESQHLDHLRYRLKPDEYPVSIKIENPQDAVGRLKLFYDDEYLDDSVYGPEENLPELISFYNNNELYNEMHFSEFFALNDYGKTGYVKINNELLNPTQNKEIIRNCDYLELSLRHLSELQTNDESLNDGVELFRGEVRDFSDINSLSENDIMTVNHFFSTTEDPNTAEGFIVSDPADLDKDKVNVIYKIEEALPYSGAKLDHVMNDGENEYLFLPKTKFQITNIEYIEGEKLFRINLKQIPISPLDFNSRINDLVREITPLEVPDVPEVDLDSIVS